MKIPHPIPYQGSKRQLAIKITSFIPKGTNRIVEPFAGSAAISIASAFYHKCKEYHLNDINKPLMDLWFEIINSPEKIADAYEKLWNAQLGKEKKYFAHIRDEFNKAPRSDYFLYLMARCVKGAIRYNSKGKMNQSPDNRRKGRKPEAMRDDILLVSQLFRGRTEITSLDYREVFEECTSEDLVYMDPPYQGTSGDRDARYLQGVDVDEFAEGLAYLNKRRIPFILSYDGRTGDKTYGKELPASLEMHRIEIDAGRSTQATLLGKKDITYESLYLSPELVEKLGRPCPKVMGSMKSSQLCVALG